MTLTQSLMAELDSAVALSSRRARTARGEAGKRARAIAADAVRIAARESLARIDAQAEEERETRVTALHSAFGRIATVTEALAHTDDPATIASLTAELEAAKASRDAVFALPIIPSDVSPGGRFERRLASLFTTHDRVGKNRALATGATPRDILNEALALAYEDDEGLVATDRFRTTRHAVAYVPTLGTMYRLCRLAYFREVSLARKVIAGTVESETLEYVVANLDGTAVHMATDEPDAHPLDVMRDRVKLARDAFPFGAIGADADSIRSDLAVCSVLAKGASIDDVATHLGVLPRTIVARISSIRVYRRDGGIVGARRIAPDSRKRYAPKESPREGWSVSRDGTVASDVSVHYSHLTRLLASNEREETLARIARRSAANFRCGSGDTVSGLSSEDSRKLARWTEEFLAEQHKSSPMTYERPCEPFDGVTESDRQARIDARHARVLAERQAESNARTARRLRFLTIARATRKMMESAA